MGIRVVAKYIRWVDIDVKLVDIDLRLIDKGNRLIYMVLRRVHTYHRCADKVLSVEYKYTSLVKDCRHVEYDISLVDNMVLRWVNKYLSCVDKNRRLADMDISLVYRVFHNIWAHYN